MFVVGVDEDDAVLTCAQEIIKFTLGAYHTLKRTESLEVSLADIGDDAAVGLHDVDQGAYLTWVVGPHLHDGDVVLAGKLQQRLGHADVVVEVAACVEHVVFLAEHSGYEFLGGGFAVGACHTDDAGA